MGTHVSWKSSIVPEVRDCWAIFRLFDGTYDEIPDGVDVAALQEASFWGYDTHTPYFVCESSMFYFRKRKYDVLGNDSLPDKTVDVNEDYIQFQHNVKHISFGVYNDYNDADSDLIAAMGNECNSGKG